MNTSSLAGRLFPILALLSTKHAGPSVIKQPDALKILKIEVKAKTIFTLGFHQIPPQINQHMIALIHQAKSSCS